MPGSRRERSFAGGPGRTGTGDGLHRGERALGPGVSGRITDNGTTT